MVKATLIAAGAAFIGGAAAQQTAYGQCGGIGWTGLKTCVSGYYCQNWNDYYFQCMPGTASTTTKTSSSVKTSSTKATSSAKPTSSVKSTSSAKPPTSSVKPSSSKASSTLITTAKPSSSSAAASSSAVPTSSSTVTVDPRCTNTFTPVSASAYFASMDPGWNVGNTMDAIPNEGSWNNPPVVGATFDDVKAAGFKGIRLPVTYSDHFISGSPSWNVDPAWLQRVSDVVDMITSRGMPVLTNVHHDSWNWFDMTVAGANYTMIEEKFYRVWYQIGTKLACKGPLVAFEPINEPPGSTAEHGAELNKLQGLFLKAITDAGGHNSKRVVTLVGLNENSDRTSAYFDRSIIANYTNPWGIQYHYYSPYDFIFSAWGKTTWGSDADKATLEADIANIRNNFTDVPLIIGEWAASPVATETAARWRYFDFFTRTARKYNTATVLWDNGADFLDRAAHFWRDGTANGIYVQAQKGVANALPDSTTDGGATTQFTSADIFHKVGDPVTDQTLPFLLNGNTVSSIKAPSGTALTASDYSVAGSSVTFSSAFLSQYFTATAAPGSLGNLTMTFSAGAPLTVNLVQWDVPTLGATTSVAVAGADLHIPITFKGINKPATVKAATVDGAFLFDDWTQYLGPLQQGRSTYNNQWNWDGTSVIITSSAVGTVIGSGKSAVFTIELYPRVPGNAVNYTLTLS